jgi:hypothetical protein
MDSALGSFRTHKMPQEPHWIVKGLFTAVLGAIPWIVLGYVLNVLVPIAGLIVCCESLGPTYYQFAYWLPMAVSGVVVAVVLLAWAKDAASTRSPRDRWKEAAKAAAVVVGLCLYVWARSLRLI